MKNRKRFMPKTALHLTVSTIAVVAMCGAPAAMAQDSGAQGAANEDIEEIVTIGTRVKGRTITQTAVPVDIITSDSLRKNGQVETARLLRNLAPSFNYYETTIGDGSDILRPATLRGLGPDQVLILVNGKRRVGFPWIGVGQTVNRGSTGVDLNSIPSSGIGRIEILRDGASSQYGSDAIAGVINIQLRNDVDQTQMQARFGQTYEGDGAQWMLSGNTGFSLGDGGFLNLTFEARDINRTNRADVSGNTGTVVMRIGDTSISDNYNIAANLMLPISESVELYSFGTYATRKGLSGGFFRWPFAQDRSVPQVFPDGFLPLQTTKVEDIGVVGGIRFRFADDWELDTSVNYGRNEFGFGVQNSINASIAAQFRQRNPLATDAEIAANSGPNEGFSGAAELEQLIVGVDLAGAQDIGLPELLHIATGVLFRHEKYTLKEGDFESFSCGDSATALSIPSLFQDLSVPADEFTSFANCGFQGFPGYSSQSAGSVSRDNWAIYLDLETNITDQWLVTGAVRWEDFEGTGDKVTGKFATRFEMIPGFAVRGAVQTGFRAPSLPQVRFTSVTTSAGATGLVQTLLAPNDDPFTQALGIGTLELETSQNYSVGFVWDSDTGFTFTVDAYQINIDNRIVLSGTIDPAQLAGNNDAAIAALEARGIGQGQFFVNAVDTRTRGVDLVATFTTPVARGSLTSTLAISVVDNKVKKVNDVGNISKDIIFNEANVINVEDSAPSTRITATMDYSDDKFGALVRVNYFSKTQSGFFGFANPAFPAFVFVDIFGADPADVRKVKAAALVDLELSYNFTDFIQIAVGADNIFDTKPNKVPKNSISRLISDGLPQPGVFGNFKFPWRGVAYGLNGGFYYFRTLVTF